MTRREIVMQIQDALNWLETERGDALYCTKDCAERLADLLIQLSAIAPKHYHEPKP